MARFNKTKDGTDRVKDYIVHQYNFSLNEGKVTKVYFAQAAEKPLGTLADKFKPRLGREILAKYKAEIDEKRSKSLDELTALTEELDLYEEN